MDMIEVIKPGLLTTVQDQGRWGYQSYGVGIAGAMDSFALPAANLLVGNIESAAGLEMTLLGPTLKFQDESLFCLNRGGFDPALGRYPFTQLDGPSCTLRIRLEFWRTKEWSSSLLGCCWGN